MLTFAMVLIFVLATALNLSQFNKMSVAENLPFSIFIAMIWATVFGMFDKLFLGASLLLPVTLVTTLLMMKFKSDFFVLKTYKEILSLPVVAFVALAGWTFRHSQHWQFSEWDEFTHWGLVVKAMDFFNVLGPASPTSLNSSEYPPGLAAISYLVVKIGGRFDEADVLWAYQLLALTILISILKGFNYRKILSFSFSFLILVFSAVAFYNSFQTVYSDPILSIVFGFALFTSTSSKNIGNRHSFLNLLIIVISMMLIKDIAIYFVLIPITLFILNKIFFEKSAGLPKLIIFRNSTVRILISFLTVFLTRYLWTAFVSRSNSGKPSETEFSRATSQLSLTNLTKNPNYLETKSTFLDRVFNGGPIEITDHDKVVLVGFQFNTIQWIYLFAFLMGLIVISQKSTRLRIQESMNSIVILLGAFGYLFVLFLIYLIVYSGANTRSLISYDRYVSTYLSGILFFLGARAVKQISEASKLNDDSQSPTIGRGKLLIPAYSVCLILTLMFQSKSEYVSTYINKPNEFSDGRRGEFLSISEKVKLANFKPSDRVWIIAQHTMGFEFYVLQYEVFPANVGRIPYSIGSPAFYGDPWTDPTMTLDRWKTSLDNYDYVIVYKSTDSFASEYGAIFDNPNSLSEQRIYKVVHGSNGNKLVEYI
jgi:hypothetical protein